MNFELVGDALMAITGLAALASAGNLLRRPREPAELEPNCLLTRYPIEFWTGPRTIFYFKDFWGDLPVNLRAHGHDVRVVRLPWRNAALRREWASTLPQTPRHLIVDATTAAEFSDYFGEHPPLSLTIIDPPLTRALDRICFSLHRLALRASGLNVRTPKRATDPCASLRNLVRDLAEDDLISS